MISSNRAVDGPAGAMARAAVQDEDVSIECYENAVPPYVEAALQQLYGNIFSTLAHRRVYGGARNVSTFVVRSETGIASLWLFERGARVVRVLNEGIEVSEVEVTRFAGHVFAAFPTVGAITFHAVQARVQRLPLPFQRHDSLEDMVLKLPASTSEYLAQMGKSTRSYIHRYLNKLKRDFPSMRFQLTEGREVRERDILHIVELNRARMADKGKVSINDVTLSRQIARLALDCGMIGRLTIDGRVAAGTINYRVRDNYFLEVIAHDPAYNDYRLGTLCCYLTVCECIARGGDEYHFLWGSDEYKTRLQGKRRDLADLAVYRSRVHVMLHADTALRHARSAWQRRAHMWLRSVRQRHGMAARMAQWASAVWRRLRRA